MNDFLNNDMLQDFFEESKEMLEVLNQGILTLEQSGGGNIEIVNEIFRSAHTLKGMSGMMGFNNMNHLTHTMENVLDKVRNGQLVLSTDQVDVLFECLDKLNIMINEISTNGSDANVDVEATIIKLKNILNSEKTAAVEKKQSSKSASANAAQPSVKDTAEYIDIDYLKQLKIPQYIIDELNAYDVEKIQEFIENDFNLYLIEYKMERDFLTKGKSILQFFKKLSAETEVILSSTPVNQIPNLKDFKIEKFDLDLFFIIASKFEKKEFHNKIDTPLSMIKDIFLIYQDAEPELQTEELNIPDKFVIDLDGEFVTPEILSSFKEEAVEHIQEFNSCLLEIEKDINHYNPDYINIMFRAMHTLKGLANMFGLTPISEFTHKIENSIDAVRNEKIQIDSEMVDLLLKNCDILNTMLRELVETNQITKIDKTALIKLINYMNIKLNAGDEISADSDNAYNIENYFFGESDTEKIKECIDDGKNIFEIYFYYKKDFNEKFDNFELMRNKIELFGDILGLTVAIDKIGGLTNFEVEDFDLPLKLYFATVESETTISMLMDKSEEEVKKLSTEEIKKIIENGEKNENTSYVDIKTKTEKPKKKVQPSQKTEAPRPITAVKKSEPIKETQAAASQKIETPATVSAATATADKKNDDASSANTPAQATPATANASSSTVRVDIEKLDTLMNLVGELLICKTQVEQIGLTFDLNVVENRSKLKFMTEQLGRVTNDLQEAIMKTRMIPIGTVFNRFPRVVRDIAKNRGKKVNLVIRGEETELDKTVIEEIGDPMVHLIRNAVDHGVETPEKRIAAGKTEIGTLTLNAYHEGNHIIIEIEDDGAGIDPDVIKRKALEKNLISEDEARTISDNDIVRFIFKAGFSTAEKVTDISGRGVGMDVVKSNISKINGIVDIQTKLGEGTKFIIKLPLTLAIINSLLVKVSDQIFAVPLASVIESVKIDASEINSIEGKYEIIKLRNTVIPIIKLNKEFKLDTPQKAAKMFVVVIGLAEEKFAVVVDELLGQQEIVIKSLNHKIVSTPGIAGATILGDGQVVLIIDVSTVIANSKKKFVKTR